MSSIPVELYCFVFLKFLVSFELLQFTLQGDGAEALVVLCVLEYELLCGRVDKFVVSG